MSKNLLIALGDSWTHGAGIRPHIPMLGVGPIPRNIIEQSNILTKEEKEYYLNVYDERERNFSWPKVCADILGWDFINMGLCANSNPGIVKSRINHKLEHYKEEYDRVVVVFLLTDPTRFGVYVNGGVVQNITVRGFSYINGKTQEDVDISKNVSNDILTWYLGHMVPQGSLSETLFSLEYVKYFTKSCGYEFYWGTAFTPYQEIINSFNTNYCLHDKRFDSFRDMIIQQYKKEGLSSCGHANELGYELIAKYIAHEIELRGN